MPCDESWIYCYDLEIKSQSFQWKHTGSPRSIKARQSKSTHKLLMIPHVWACQWPSSQPLSSQLSQNDCLWAEGISKSHKEQRLDNRKGEELSWCPSWSNSLWQGCSCGLVHCPGGNATKPIWRVLASSDRISFWTPLKAQHSNPNPNPLANQLWSIDFLTPPTPLIISHRLPAFLESLITLKSWCLIHARWSKSSLKHSIRFCGIQV